mgnify:CR=1 FL=1
MEGCSYTSRNNAEILYKVLLAEAFQSVEQEMLLLYRSVVTELVIHLDKLPLNSEAP